MYAISDAFRTALTRSHAVVTRAEVLDGGTVVQTLAITGGSVTVDKTAAVRRSCSVELVDPTGALVPADAADLLHPSSGNELRLWRGITLPTGDELVPLGVFRLMKPAISDTGDALTMRIDGMDRTRRVQRARFTDVYVIASGTNYATAIQTLLASRVPSLTFSFATTTRTTPQLVFEAGSDPWEAATSMATAIGYELFFDPAGTCVLRAEPDPSTDPVVWTYQEGADATVLSLDKDLDDEHTYNHVIVTGESSGNAAPVRAEARDDNASSPTYYLGDYGDVPYFYTSPLITTVAQAQDAADALLRRVLGVAEEVSFSAVVNPAHDAGDVMRITRARMRVDANYLLERVEVPLAATDAMSTTTRKRVI